MGDAPGAAGQGRDGLAPTGGQVQLFDEGSLNGAHQFAQAETAAWTARQTKVPMTFLHADLPGTFAYQAPLLDLARTENVPTAQAVDKNLEYRSPALELAGAGWPWLLTVLPVLVGLAGVLLLFGGKRALACQQGTAIGSTPASRSPAHPRATSA